jgi:tetratricopeptide (TPR) repeat protein
VTVVYFVIRSLAIGFAFGENPNAKPIVETLATFPMLVVYYARFLLWPFGMGPSYPLRYVDVWSDARAWAILLVIVIAAVGIWHFTRRDRLARFGLLWIVFTVWPVFNVRAFRETYLVHQRYLYLAVFGLCLFVAGVILSRWGNKTRSHIALGMTAVIYALATMLHIGAWSSDRALYLRIAELDPANVAAWGWLGHDAREKGNTQEAREFLNTAITNDPMHGYAHRELGIMDLKSARMNSAIAHLRQAVAWYEDQPQSRHLLIECRENLAGALASVGRMGEALTLSQLHAGPPDYSPQSAINAALLLMQQSNWDQAERILSQATEKNESNDRILETLAGLYLQTGRPEKARALAQKAVSINSQTVWAQEILQAR